MKTQRNGVVCLGICSVALACLALSGCSEKEQASSAEGEVPQIERDKVASGVAASPEAVVLPEAAVLVPRAAGLEWDVPESWIAQQPSSAMRMAQYDAGGVECVVYHFGSGGGGGDAEDNITRWSSQVLDGDGLPSVPALASFSVVGLQVTTVALRGTYMSGMPGAGERTPEPESLLLGAILEGGPEGSLFVRMVGAEAQVDGQREAWEMMVRTIRIADSE